MANAPRIEAKVTLASNLVLTVDDGGGADVATVTAGSYYPYTLLGLIKAALDLATGDVFTVTGSFAPSGTGLVTVSIGSGTFKLLFASNADAQLFGVALAGTWNGSPAASFTGTAGMKGVWIPKCPMGGPGVDLDLTGHLRSDLRQAKGPTGAVFGASGNSYRSFRAVRFSHVERDRCLDGVNAAVVSWQQFVRECVLGDSVYFPTTSGVQPTVRVHFDASQVPPAGLLGAAGGGDGVYYLILDPSLECGQPVEGYSGLWSVEIKELVKT